MSRFLLRCVQVVHVYFMFALHYMLALNLFHVFSSLFHVVFMFISSLYQVYFKFISSFFQVVFHVFLACHVLHTFFCTFILRSLYVAFHVFLGSMTFNSRLFYVL